MLALGFVCCGLLAFYVYTSHKTIDITEFYHPYVQLNKDEYEEFAKVYPNVTMQLENKDKQDMHTAYFKLKNQDVYVKAEDVKEAAALTKQKMTSRYLPFNETITTNDSYTLKDGDGNALVTMNQKDSYPIYMKNKKTIGVTISYTLLINRISSKQNKQIIQRKKPQKMFPYLCIIISIPKRMEKRQKMGTGWK